jgi:hypothetical protein
MTGPIWRRPNSSPAWMPKPAFATLSRSSALWKDFALRWGLPARFEPEKILRALSRNGVRFVVIGGLAAYLQGSPLPTVDVDITPEGGAENMKLLSDVLKPLDARVRAEGTEPLRFDHSPRSLAVVDVWNLSTLYGDLDISQVPAGTRGYEDLIRDAVEVSIGGESVLLASLADIVRSKDAAGRDKDRRALPVLRELLARQKQRK